jgi:hypothetical protein
MRLVVWARCGCRSSPCTTETGHKDTRRNVLCKGEFRPSPRQSRWGKRGQVRGNPSVLAACPNQPLKPNWQSR